MSRKLYDNTETLEEVLELLNNKAAGGGGTDTSDATATSADILIDKTAYANGEKLTGSIPLQSAKTITPSASEQVAISSGYYASGDVTVQGDANLTAENIKKGATIFGVEGNYEGEGGENKVAKIADGTIEVELTAEDLAGATKIRGYAFYEVNKLTSVVIPNSVTSIGNFAFYYCTSLKSVVIGNSVTSIGTSAFYGCSNLTSVVIYDAPVVLNTSCFQDCTRLVDVNLGQSVTDIKGRVFRNCSSLEHIFIPKTVKFIGSYAFLQCTNLKRIDLSKHTSVPTLDSADAFNDTHADLQIKVPATLIDSWKVRTNWSNYANSIVTEFTNTL